MKNLEVFVINNKFYIILNNHTINDIKNIHVVYKNNQELYVLLEIDKNKLKINLAKYINFFNETNINNKIIQKKKKQINLRDIIILLTDIKEFNKLNKGLVYEIPLKNLLF